MPSFWSENKGNCKKLSCKNPLKSLVLLWNMKLLTGCSFGCEKLQYRKIEVLSTLKLPALIFKVLQKKNMEFSSKLVVAVYYYNCYLVSMVCGFADTQKRDENSIFANFDGAYLALAFSFPGYLCKKSQKSLLAVYIVRNYGRTFWRIKKTLLSWLVRNFSCLDHLRCTEFCLRSENIIVAEKLL